MAALRARPSARCKLPTMGGANRKIPARDFFRVVSRHKISSE